MKYAKHILILTPGFPVDKSDENCIPPLQAFLEKVNSTEAAKVSVIAFQYPFVNQPYQWKGIDVYPANGRNSKFLRKWITWQRCKSYFKKIQEKESIDLIHSFWLSECAYIGHQLSRRHNIPHLTTLMGQDVLPSNRYLKLFNSSLLKTVALSNYQAQQYQITTGNTVDYTVPFGIDPLHFPPLNEGERPIDILGVGSLSQLKNYRNFVKLIQMLIPNHASLKAVIIGEGSERKTVEKLIQQEGLENHLELKGNLPRKEVLSIMNQSKVFLHTSQYESLGYVFPEALMCGCQLVSHAVGLANPTPQWSVEKDLTGMAKAVSNALDKKAVRNEQIIPVMKNSVKSYLNIYDASIG